MNRGKLDTNLIRRSDLTEKIGWFDVETRCTVVVARPSEEPQLWQEYLQGAVDSYRRHGVGRVLDVDAVRDGSDTRIFFAAVAEDGTVVGGTRISFPLTAPEDSVAINEWAGHPGLGAVRSMLSVRLPFGVVEGRTAWVDGEPGRRGSLFRMLVRTAPITLQLLNVRYVVSSGGAHVVDKWCSSGGVVAGHIPPAPYPDDRYRTQLIWWDRTTVANDMEPQQLARMSDELAEIARRTEIRARAC